MTTKCRFDCPLCPATLQSGGGGIRTHGDLMATTVFETVRFVHSRTPPGCMNYCVDRAILADQLAGKVRASRCRRSQSVYPIKIYVLLPAYLWLSSLRRRSLQFALLFLPFL